MGAPPAPTHRANLQSDPGKPRAPVWPPLLSSRLTPAPFPAPHPLHFPGFPSARSPTPPPFQPGCPGGGKTP